MLSHADTESLGPGWTLFSITVSESLSSLGHSLEEPVTAWKQRPQVRAWVNDTTLGTPKAQEGQEWGHRLFRILGWGCGDPNNAQGSQL